ncbi:putative transcription factor GRAS family [Rosa chinensis]|uniref:Putative transcription factor GRAS family n=1 Tax=Rosa chinensis TaxID=74649 RepID=A0A2P6PI40_ROSCH|nr:DELLA protein RGL1 [Rosa chinensis]PRQ21606.1 putative transcription factor GRAS family [Rosa chinensis]
MANAFFSFTPFDFEIQGGLSPPQLEDYDIEDTVMFNVRKGDHLFGLEDQLGEMNTPSEHGFYLDNNKAKKGVVESHLSKDQNQHHDLDHQQQQQQSKPNFLILDNFNSETVSSQRGFYHANKAGKDHQHHHHQEQQQYSKSSSSNLENFSSFDFTFPSGQVTQPVEDSAWFTHSQIGGSDIVETIKKMQPPQSYLATLELLNSYGSAFKKLRGGRQRNSRIVKGKEIDQNSSYVVSGKQKLSIEEVMRVAGARFVQFSSQGYEYFYMSMHPFGYALSGLCEEETKDVELAHLLLAAAEKVGYQQFERASRLLLQVEWLASFKGTPVQKVVCYFAEALRERIEKETGLYTSKGNEEMSHYVHGLGTNLAFIACHQEVPFHPVLQFAAIQTMIENVANESRIHLIDLEIRFGTQWTGLMEALAEREECPVELLTITAVGVRGKQNIKETGERLTSVAMSLNLPFQFKEVIVSDMQDINDRLFDEIEDDQALVVYAPLVLRTMIARPRCLENLMRVMRNINPSLMVVIEVEANHNSPSFVNRFIDALFYHSAFFDCVETCMTEGKSRVIMEGLLREGIRNIVAAEGSERVARSVKMDVWRAFFASFSMVEMSFSNTSLYQANEIAKEVSCTTLDKNGKCLIVGWKGTPIHSLSAWKFR